MLVGRGGIARVGALHREAVAGECVRGLCTDEVFQNLAARLLLWLGHGHAIVYSRWRVSPTVGQPLLAVPQESQRFSGSVNEPMKRSSILTNAGNQSEKALPGRPVRDSRTQMTELVLPQDSNLLGNILGGRVMHMIDIAGAIAAHRHCHRQVVTASVDHLDFLNPVRVGDLIVLEAQVNRAFHTSVEVGVEVFSEDSIAGIRNHTTKAFLTFVALDELGRPVPVPPLIVKTSEEKRRYREAGERRKLRIKSRKRG